MSHNIGIEDFDGNEIIRVDDDFDGSKHLILGEEKGFFKPEDTFWLDEYIVKEWNLRSPNNFSLEITTDTGAIHEVKGVSCAKKGGYITATTKTINKMGLKVGAMLFVRPINS